MIKQKLTILAAAIVVAASVATTQAAFVTGTIGFTGQAVLNTASAGTATGVSSWVNPSVNGASGAFSVIPTGTSATFAAPWNFNSGASPFWTVSSGGETFVFNLLTSTITSQAPGFVYVTGSGLVSGSGNTVYAATAMSWSFTAQDPAISGQTFTFSASTAAIPEPSTIAAGALLLLPFGISTMRILRKSKNS